MLVKRIFSRVDLSYKEYIRDNLELADRANNMGTLSHLQLLTTLFLVCVLCCTVLILAQLDYGRFGQISTGLSRSLFSNDGNICTCVGNSSETLKRRNVTQVLTERQEYSISNLSTPGGVPMILHFVYKDTSILEAYRSSMESCIKMNSNWTVMLWTDYSVSCFINREFPRYQPVFYNFPHKIQRADAIRYLILYRLGGVYLDLDMSCRQPLLASLSSIPCFLDREREHQSLVLHGRQRTAMNSAMGCRPGHPFFKKMVDFVFHPDRLKGSFIFPNTIFVTTGPFALTQVYDDWHNSKSQPAVKLLNESYFSPRINPRSGVYGTCRSALKALKATGAGLSAGQKACLELQTLGFEKSDEAFVTNRTVAIHEFTHLGYRDHTAPKFDALKWQPGIRQFASFASHC